MSWTSLRQRRCAKTNGSTDGFLSVFPHLLEDDLQPSGLTRTSITPHHVGIIARTRFTCLVATTKVSLCSDCVHRTCNLPRSSYRGGLSRSLSRTHEISPSITVTSTRLLACASPSSWITNAPFRSAYNPERPPTKASRMSGSRMAGPADMPVTCVPKSLNNVIPASELTFAESNILPTIVSKRDPVPQWLSGAALGEGQRATTPPPLHHLPATRTPRPRPYIRNRSKTVRRMGIKHPERIRRRPDRRRRRRREISVPDSGAPAVQRMPAPGW